MRYIAIAALSILVLTACSKKENGNLHITGNVQGLRTGKLYIKKIKDTALVTIDSITIDGDPHFTSDLQIDSPEMYYLFLNRGATNSLDNSVPFFAEAGNINIETTLDYFLYDAKITGSKNHDKYAEFKNITTAFNDRNLTFMEMKFKALKNKNMQKVDSIEALQQANTKRQYLYTTNFALTNKDLEVSPYVALTEIANINLKYLDTIQKSMSPKVAQSLYGKKLREFYNQRKQAEK